MHTVHQSFIRGDIHHVEMAERDELGRQVGGFVVVDLRIRNDNGSAVTLTPAYMTLVADKIG